MGALRCVGSQLSRYCGYRFIWEVYFCSKVVQGRQGAMDHLRQRGCQRLPGTGAAVVGSAIAPSRAYETCTSSRSYCDESRIWREAPARFENENRAIRIRRNEGAVARDVAERCRRQCRSLTVAQKASKPSCGHFAMGPALCSVGGGIVSSVSIIRTRADGILSNHGEVCTGLRRSVVGTV